MVRETNIVPLTYGTNGVTYFDLSGNSLDTKPTAGVATGSTFVEVDTGDVYFYDEDSETWNKLANLGGDL